MLHASAGLGNVELISFFMGYGVEAVCLFVFCFPISQRRRCEWICLRWILAMPRELHLCTLHPRLLRSLGCGEELISCYEPKIAMASNLLAMASNLIAMASNLIAMASM